MTKTNEDQERKEGAAIAAPLPDGTTVRRFQYTSLDGNSNKFYLYEIKEISGGYVNVVGRFGRVGDKGQTFNHGDMSHEAFDHLVRARKAKGYVEVELHSAVPVPAGGAALSGADLSSPEGRLVAIIYQEAGEAIQKYLAVSVDALSATQLQRGRILLGAIRASRDIIVQGAGSLGAMIGQGRMILQSVEAYYRTIPTNLPRRINPAELAQHFDLAEQENRLDQLEAAVASLKITSGGGTQVQGLGCEIHYLQDPDVWRSIKGYVESTQSAGRGLYGSTLKVKEIFEVLIPQERAAYKALMAGLSDNLSDRGVHGEHLGNKKLLFHGTRNQNVRHILRTGLKIMGTAANGRALGNGLYFADQSAKAANYTGTAGRASSAPLMMLLSEVALGKIKEAGSWSGNNPPQGYDSVFSKAYGGYQFNEYCVFRANRATARYLITFSKS